MAEFAPNTIKTKPNPKHPTHNRFHSPKVMYGLWWVLSVGIWILTNREKNWEVENRIIRDF